MRRAVDTFAPGRRRPPVYAFSDDDVIVTSPDTFDLFPGLDAAANEITATYPEPGEGWAAKAAPSRANAALLALDGGRRNIADLSFPASLTAARCSG